MGTCQEYLCKCYSLEVLLNKEIEAVEFSMKNYVFQNKTWDSLGGMISFFHLKNQCLESSESLALIGRRKTWDQELLTFILQYSTRPITFNTSIEDTSKNESDILNILNYLGILDYVG